jgi:glycosyltransferase 2 family protein
MKSLKKKFSFYLSIGFSFTILWYLGSSLEWSTVGQILKKMNLSYIFLWIILFIFATFLRSYRWKLLISSNQNMTLMSLYDALNIGNMATMILPLRAGEIIRPLLLTRWTGITFGRSFASVVIERVFDVSGMFLMFLFAVRGINELPDIVLLGAKLLSIFAGVIILAMIISYSIPDKIMRIIDSFAGISEKVIPPRVIRPVVSISKEFISGLSGIENLIQLSLVLISTVLIWIAYVISFQVLFLSLGESGSLAVGAVSCVFVSLFIAAPSAPGFLGTFQLGCVAALTGVFSYSEEFSIAFSIVAHSLQFIGIIILGIISMFFRGLKFSSIQSE